MQSKLFVPFNLQNQLNYIRFPNFVAISEIRIVPFGSVVESNISDEAVIG